GLPLRQVGVLAGERVLLHLRPGHPGLDQGVVGGQLVAERAVALLQPAGGPVDADADRHQPMARARLPQRVPQPGPLLHRHVQLPAELADVGDARGEHGKAAGLNLAAGAERESGMAVVVRAEVRSARAAVPSAGRWSANHFFSAMPVAPPVTTRKWAAPSRMIVRSALNPPRSSSSEV